MKLLVIEDEPELRNLLLRHLKREGFRCEHAVDFRGGYQKIINHDYDCVIVDLNLPGGDGLKLVRLLRDNNHRTGILILSARDTIEDKVAGLEQGSDDYLTKPFHLSELNARIKAVLRRKGNDMEREMLLGDLTIRPDERVALVGGQSLGLTRKEFDILWYLARNKNRVVTKDSIAEHLWGDYMDDAVSFDFIYAHVKNLRKKLSDFGCGEVVETVYGIGYKFVVP